MGQGLAADDSVTAAKAPNPLLPKARSLARNNTVTLTATSGGVTAEVIESGRTQQVRIDLPRWPDDTQAEAERLIAKTLAHHRGLATDDLPDELEADFRQRGIVIAVPLEEQRSECDCQARKRPCQHILATLYALVQRIDERPRLAVEVRSRELTVSTPRDPDRLLLTDIDPAHFYGP